MADTGTIAFVAVVIVALGVAGWFALGYLNEPAQPITATATVQVGASNTPVVTASTPPSPLQEQVVKIRALSSVAYDQPEVTVKAGTPVRLEFTADPGAGCGIQFILDGFGVQLVSRNGQTQTAKFTPTMPGDYRYHCGMNMFRGVMHVVP